ncbi:MAG: citrate transporter, partial [Clostridium sp.]|nr:citrate transporter [Clostridium sp.]
GSCITQSWVAWGLAYTKVESRDFLKLSIPNAYLTGVIQYVAAFILLGGLGAAWFI